MPARDRNLPGAVAAAAFVVYLPSLGFDFLEFWDDRVNLYTNEHLVAWTWANLKWMWTAKYLGVYMPLSWMSFAVDYRLWGAAPGGWHLSAALLHAAGAGVLALCASRILGDARAGAAAAALWALHPMRVESVVWVSNRSYVLGALLAFVSVWCYLRSADAGARRGRRWLAASVAAFALSLSAKGIAIMLPFALLALDRFVLKRRAWGEKLWFFAPAALVTALSFWARGDQLVPVSEFGPLDRAVATLYQFARYAVLSAAPLRLPPVVSRPRPFTPAAPEFLAAAALTLVVAAVAWRARRGAPRAFAAVLAYALLAVPMSALAQYGWQLASDKWAHLASVPLFLAAAAWGARRRHAARLALAVLAAFAARTLAHERHWRDSATLFGYAARLRPGDWAARRHLAGALGDAGDLDGAEAEFRRILEAFPADSGARAGLASALMRRGDLEGAAREFETALAAQEGFNWADRTAYGGVLQKLGREAEAEREYRAVLAAYPEAAIARLNLGHMLLRRGEIRAGVDLMFGLRKTRGFGAADHYWLGVALAKLGELDAAREELEAALGADPGDTKALYNLAGVHLMQGRLAQGSSALRRCLALEPGHPDCARLLGAVQQ